MRITLALLAACTPVSPETEANPSTSLLPNGLPEACGNGVDDDLDGAVDCFDGDCDGACAEDCIDGRDNDGDLAIDCDDNDCNVASCPEDCVDGRDNDGDGTDDCSDTDCSVPECDELCTDDRDNDGDSAVDCDDADCDGECPEDCVDGRDNDVDGWVDCDDVDCTLACPEDCSNGVDDDADAAIDCLDEECAPICDADGDGYLNGDYGGDDCDDLLAEVNPGAVEVCNGIDDECDGLVDMADPLLDQGTMVKFYRDDDGDGFGDKGDVGEFACEASLGRVADRTDCDDLDAEINPLGLEVCNGKDDDCDSLVDDADGSVDLSTATDWYVDMDGDGFGTGIGVFACTPPPGHVDNDDDCDDSDVSVLGPGDFWFDDDGDGFGDGALYGIIDCTSPAAGWEAVSKGEDCDDILPDIYPGAAETCEDGIDQDCDGLDASCCAAPKPDCEFSVLDDTCYFFCVDKLIWADARDYCLSEGGHLMTLDDADEEIWADATVDVIEMLRGVVGSYWWHGFTDRGAEGVWVWDDGTPVSYTNWYAGEPNNVGNEDCATINQFTPSLGWNDQTCAALNPYICER